MTQATMAPPVSMDSGFELPLPPDPNKPHQEARGQLAKQRDCYCPCGCTLEGVDEYGYCHHLVGFVSVEPHLYTGSVFRVTESWLERWKGELLVEEVHPEFRYTEEGIPEQTGRARTGLATRGPVQVNDLLVNPERYQLDQGHSHLAKAWVSARVYRPTASKKAKLPPPSIAPNEEAILARRLKDLKKQAAARLMKDEIAALEKQLGIGTETAAPDKQPSIAPEPSKTKKG